MRTRSNVIFAGIFGLALLATGLLFAIPHFVKDDVAGEGKLSPDVIKVESEYKAIQQEWKANEPAFRAAGKEVTDKLTKLQGRAKSLSKRTESLNAQTKEEGSALPHLVASIHSFASAMDPYVVRLMAPERVSPAVWEKKNEDMKAAEAEWVAWVKATGHMSR